MLYAQPGQPDSKLSFRKRYENFIGGKWREPAEGRYFTKKSPVDGRAFCEVPRSGAEDIEFALDAAHHAKERWGSLTVTKRAAILNKIAAAIEANREMLALAISWETGKPIRESLMADVPLAADQFRYFAACIRAQEGGISQIDASTLSYYLPEPIGVVGLIVPWNFPLTSAAYKLAPALAAGNCVVVKPAEISPVSLLVLMELIADLLPPGVVNIINGFGEEAGAALARSPRIGMLSFTGGTNTGRGIMRDAGANVIPLTLELGGKSPNIFFGDLMQADDELLEKAVEGFAIFAVNQGEVCTCPSRALIHESIYDEFMERALAKVARIRHGNPLDTQTNIGAQASEEHLTRILSHFEAARKEGAACLAGGRRKQMDGALADGYYVEPTVFAGENSMSIFQEEIFGPVVAVTRFRDIDEAITLANDTRYGLGAGVWTRDLKTAMLTGQKIQAGRVWVNCYNLFPAHAPFSGRKQSGYGCETHKKMLEHYQHIKNVIISTESRNIGLYR